MGPARCSSAGRAMTGKRALGLCRSRMGCSGIPVCRPRDSHRCPGWRAPTSVHPGRGRGQSRRDGGSSGRRCAVPFAGAHPRGGWPASVKVGARQCAIGSKKRERSGRDAALGGGVRTPPWVMSRRHSAGWCGWHVRQPSSGRNRMPVGGQWSMKGDEGVISDVLATGTGAFSRPPTRGDPGQ